MKRTLLIAACALAVSCNKRDPAVSDAAMNEIRAEYPGMTEECLEKLRWGGVPAVPQRTDECFKMTKQRRWHGLFRNGMEFSRFCAAPTDACSDETEGESICLTASSSANLPPYRGGPFDNLYEVDFVGRETAYRGHYCHQGMADREIIIDRMISMKEIEPPPEQ